jgi:predicted PurR-regulated permease PerM
MPETRRRDAGAHFLLVLASVVVVVAGLKAASSLLLPFLVSLFLALVSLPLLNWLQSVKVPRGLAVLLTLVIVVSVLVLMLSLVAGSVSGFTEELPKYKAQLQVMMNGVIDWAEGHGIDLPEREVSGWFNPSGVLDIVAGGLLTVTSVLSNLVLVFLTIAFLLVEAAGFSTKMQAAFGRPDNQDRITRIRSEVQRYLGIKTVVSLGTGLLVTIGLWIIGVDFPLLWGLIAFLANYIPNLGSIIAAVPPVILALIQFGFWPAVGVAVFFLAINFVIGNLLEPNLMGQRLEISTLVVFLSLVFWGWVWGPVGMMLSVPLTIIIKIMLENTEDLRWIAVMLGSSPAETPEATGSA